MLSRAVLLLGSGSSRRGWPRQRMFSAASSGGGSSAEPQLGSIPLAFPAVCIWGSNTGVGKTLFSAGLAAACRRAGLSVLYLKPVQTGFPADSDARLVGAAAGLPLAAGMHAAQLDGRGHGAGSSTISSTGGSSNSSGSSLAKVLYAWQQPISPHLAVETEGRPVSDSQLAADVATELRAFGAARSSGANMPQIAIVETAGGIASPGPSGSLQCDLLRALRLPGILVGDGRLGGISATLSAYDSLALRGHQVPLVVLMDGQLQNAQAIRRHLRGKARVLAFPVCQPPPPLAAAAGSSAPEQQQQQLGQAIDANLAAWLAASEAQFDELVRLACEAHAQRLGKLQAAAGEAKRMLWWPFTQHASVGSGHDAVTVIDSRVGESFSVFRPGAAAGDATTGAAAAAGGEAATLLTDASSGSGGSGSGSGGSGSQGGRLELMYDACASWWTQGVSQKAQPELVRAVSAAAARYGHVMFPENAHEPAVELARQVLDSVGRGWAARVFYTDNGSCAIEVALKMAFRKFMADHGLLDSGEVELQVLGLEEGYHGDTLGAMDAVSPSPYNGRLQTPWYTGRGLFLDPPTVALQQGHWRVQLPASMQAEAEAAAAGSQRQQQQQQQQQQQAGALGVQFSSQAEVFDLSQRMAAAAPAAGQQPGSSSAADASAPLYRLYRQHIERQLEQYSRQHGSSSSSAASPEQQQRRGQRQLGACILEPVLQGAGGMRLVDPLYQRALVEICRERRIPVIFDEVFTGFWRLGATSGGTLLGVHPDIACYAKLLTGGVVPLAATVASEAVFKAFEGDSKIHALLHGHSYTAHPIGCSAGVAALQLYKDPALNPNWCTPEEAGRCQQQQTQQAGGAGTGASCGGPCGRLLPLWEEAAVTALSQHPSVHSVVPLGTVLAVQLRADQAGYASNAAAAVVQRLRQQGVFARPLGNVVYVMVTPMTERQQCSALLAKLAVALG